jgi:hypothetical protein
MTKNAQYSITSAKNALRMFFSNGRASTTPDDIFQLPERANKTPEINTGYLYNKLTILRHFGLVNIIKTSDAEGITRIVKINLTTAGKELLSDNPSTPIKKSPPSELITLQFITDAVDEFNRQNPSWEIELVPKRVKKEVVSIIE